MNFQINSFPDIIIKTYENEYNMNGERQSHGFTHTQWLLDTHILCALLHTTQWNVQAIEKAFSRIFIFPFIINRRETLFSHESHCTGKFYAF